MAAQRVISVCNGLDQVKGTPANIVRPYGVSRMTDVRTMTSYEPCARAGRRSVDPRKKENVPEPEPLIPEEKQNVPEPEPLIPEEKQNVPEPDPFLLSSGVVSTSSGPVSIFQGLFPFLRRLVVMLGLY